MTFALGARGARLLAALSGLLLLVGWPLPADAHASAIGSTPSDGQVLASPPSELTVTFSEPVTLARTDNALLDARGEEQPATFTVTGSVLRITPEQPLATGSHVVTWRVVSADSHPVTGGFTFAVGEATPGAVAVPASQAQRELNLVRTVVEGLRYAGVLGLAGLVAFCAFIAPAGVRRDGDVDRRTGRLTVGLAALAVLASLGLVPVIALWEAGGPLSSVLGTEAWRDGLGSSAGVAVLLTAAGAAAALWGRTRPGAVAAAGIALLLASLLPVGHTRSYGPAWLVLAADLVHVGAGALWWGGLLGLGVVLAASSLRPVERAAAVARFSSVAVVVLVALAVAGAVLFWRIAGSLPALWESAYGRAVLVKVALLAPVVVLAAWNRLELVPRLRARETAAAARLLRRTVAAEALALAAVLVATGALVGQTPPARADVVRAGVPTVQRSDLELGESHRLRVVVSPVRRGTNAVQVALVDTNDSAVDLDAVPRLQVSSDDAGVGAMNRPLSRTAPGRWEGTLDLPLPGTWKLALAVRLSRFDEPVVFAEVEVP